MRIDRISTLHDFDAERDRWERLERQDPHATVFTSWRWLRAYLPVGRYRWEVLALREGDEALAYLPLAHCGNVFDRELCLAGNPHADYTGMIALERSAPRAVDAFARELLARRWDGFNVEDVRDPRVEALVERLVAAGMRLELTVEHTGRSCALPADWETYVTERISAKTRVNTLRVERRLAEALPGFRITRITDPGADVEAHIEAMVLTNHARWGGNLRKARRRYGGLFRAAHALGILRLVVYWDGTRPIAGAAAFADHLHASFGLYMLGMDKAYDAYSPGKGIVGRAIRTAIEEGFAHFDFLRGDEPFKARYAPDLHTRHSYRLVRPGWRAAAIARVRPLYDQLKLRAATVVYGEGRSL